MPEKKGGKLPAESRKAEKDKRARLARLKQETLRKIAFLEHKAVIDYKEVYHLIREFFKGYLDKGYEFTITELRGEIKSTYIPVSARSDLNHLLDRIEEMEYLLTEYKREQLVEILELFRRTIDDLVRMHKERHGFWAKVREFIYKEEEEPIVMSELPVLENDNDVHVHLNLFLERVYLFMNEKKFSHAKKQYKELLQLYKQAPDNVRVEFYPLINETYDHLVDAVRKK